MNKTFWWRNRIGYVIYPESFSDSNDDGIGDIPGIIGKLDYLKGLGVGLLWICPLYASPRVDSGYDVADYYHVDPSFGTDEDFKTLIEEAHKRDIRLILDLPLNHTSKEHAWFKKAIADPQSEERGYYLIRPGKKDEDGHLLPPNNWKGFFHESVWTRIPGTEDFYFHLFDASMPDVDWNNPKLREEYHKIAEHYLKLGIDGFRLDVVSHLDKDISFEDAKGTADNDGLVFDPSKFSHRPSVFGFLREFKEKVFSRYDCLTIGELGAISPEEAARYADRYNGVVDMVFNFDACWLNGSYDAIGKKDEEIRLDVKHLKHNLIRWYNTCHDKCEMPLFWELHDQPRVLSQYGSTQYRDESAKALFACLLFLYGTPFVYYGDEIGMSNLPNPDLSVYAKDIETTKVIEAKRKQGYDDETIRLHLNRVSRIHARTPMQWKNIERAGFSTSDNQYPVNPNYAHGINVEDEEKNPWSIINYFRYAISLRRDPEIISLLEKPLEILDGNHPDVLAYLHHSETSNGGLVVIANLRPYDTYFGFYWGIQDVLLHNYGDSLLENHVFHLRPYECYLIRV